MESIAFMNCNIQCHSTPFCEPISSVLGTSLVETAVQYSIPNVYKSSWDIIFVPIKSEYICKHFLHVLLHQAGCSHCNGTDELEARA